MTPTRTKQWTEFAAKVADHITNYTVPQYGDAPNDNVESWSAADCIAQVQKYAARFGNNQRAGQEELDLMKIAHYAQLAHDKLKQKPFDDETAIEYLRNGKAVRTTGEHPLFILAIVGGNALSRFVNANYGTGEDEVNLPIPDQYLCIFPSGGVGFSYALPMSFTGWLPASDEDVHEALFLSPQPREADHAAR